jgi:hypothetical protein
MGVKAHMDPCFTLISGWLIGRVLEGGGVDPSQGLYLHRIAQHRKTRANIYALRKTQTHDPNIQAVKTHDSDHAVTVIGQAGVCYNQIKIT